MWISDWDKERRIARVYPAGGRAHDTAHDARCWCVPTLDMMERGVMWIHNEREPREAIAKSA